MRFSLRKELLGCWRSDSSDFVLVWSFPRSTPNASVSEVSDVEKYLTKKGIR
jgi:hypothetical protein